MELVMSDEQRSIGAGLEVGTFAVLGLICVIPVLWFLVRCVFDLVLGRWLVERSYRNKSAQHCRDRRAFAAQLRIITNNFDAPFHGRPPVPIRRLVEVTDHATNAIETAYQLERFLEWAPAEQGHPRHAGNRFVREQVIRILRQADCIEFEADKGSRLRQYARHYRQQIVDLGLQFAGVDASRPRRERGANWLMYRVLTYGAVCAVAAVAGALVFP